MTNSLRSALQELAETAGTYADADTARTIAARHARRRKRVAGGLGVGLLAGAGIALALVLGGGPAGTPDVRRSTAPPAVHESAPVVSPPSNAPDLPTGGTGVAGSLLYSPCQIACRPYLLAKDGRQFRLPPLGQGPSTTRLTLSPDGRWLGQPEVGGYRVRNLVSGEQHVLADAAWDPWAWSPDGSRLLLADHEDGEVRQYALLEVATGATALYAPPAGPGRAIGVLPDGDLLVAPRWSGGTRGPVVYRVVDPRSGLVQRAVTVDVTVQLRDDELVSPETVRLSADSSQLLVPLYDDRGDNAARSAQLVRVDLDTGQVEDSDDFPVSSDTYAVAPGVWYLLADSPRGALLGHWTSDATEVVRWDLNTGIRDTVVTIAGNAAVLAPGEARY